MSSNKKRKAVEATTTDKAMLASQSREGYFGKTSAESDSLAKPGQDRIVLHDRYGQEDDPEAKMEIQGKQEPPESLKGRYPGKVVVVTGGSKGIGEGCVRVFHAAGSNVVFCSRSDGSALADELNGFGQQNKALFMKADVSKVAELKNLIDVTVKTFGRLDCLINNAGWHPPPKTIDDFSVADMQDLFQLNFVSQFAACKYALPHIRKVKGNIINMSSLVGVFGQSQAPTYAATKGAITSFSKALAIDEAKNNVRVNIVSPGNIWTPLWKAWSDAEPDPVAAQAAGDRVQIMGRKGTIEETGRLCLCIAADLTFTTGVDHIQSGGAELGYGVK